jgi:hypothetical protein
MQLVNKFRKILFNQVLLVAGLLLLTPYVLEISRTLQEKFDPVLTVTHMDLLSREENNITFEIGVVKHKSCLLKKISWVARKDTTQWSVTVINNTGYIVTGSGSYVASGYSELGPFKAVLPDAAKDASELSATAWYECHSLYDVKQDFGSLKLK